MWLDWLMVCSFAFGFGMMVVDVCLLRFGECDFQHVKNGRRKRVCVCGFDGRCSQKVEGVEVSEAGRRFAKKREKDVVRY